MSTIDMKKEYESMTFEKFVSLTKTIEKLKSRLFYYEDEDEDKYEDEEKDDVEGEEGFIENLDTKNKCSLYKRTYNILEILYQESTECKDEEPDEEDESSLWNLVQKQEGILEEGNFKDNLILRTGDLGGCDCKNCFDIDTIFFDYIFSRDSYREDNDGNLMLWM